MFGSTRTTTLVVLTLIFLTVGAISTYRSRNKTSPKRRIHQLWLAFLLFGMMGFYLVLNVPRPGFYRFAPRPIASLEDANDIIRTQYEDIKKLAEEIDDFGSAMGLFLLLGLALLPSVYNAAKDSMLRQHDTEPKGRSSILGLNDKD